MRRSKNVGSWDRRPMTAIEGYARLRQDTRTELEDGKKGNARKAANGPNVSQMDGGKMKRTSISLGGKPLITRFHPPIALWFSHGEAKHSKPPARAQRARRPQQHPTRSRNTTFWSSTGSADAYNIVSRRHRLPTEPSPNKVRLPISGARYF